MIKLIITYFLLLNILNCFSQSDGDYYSSAIQKYDFGDFIGAKTDYEMSLIINSDNVNVHIKYSKLLLKLEDKDGALKQYVKAIQLDSNNYKNHMDFGLMLEEVNEISMARKHYEKSLKLNPAYVDAHVNYAIFLYRKLSIIKSAKFHFKKAIKLNSKFAPAHYNYALFLRSIHIRKRKSRNEYLLATQLQPSYNTKKDNAYFGIKR